MNDHRDKEYRLTPAIIKLDGNKQSFGLCLDAGDTQVGAVYRRPDLDNDLVMSLRPGVVICEKTLGRFAAMFEMMKGEIEE